MPPPANSPAFSATRANPVTARSIFLNSRPAKGLLPSCPLARVIRSASCVIIGSEAVTRFTVSTAMGRIRPTKKTQVLDFIEATPRFVG